MAEKVPAFIYSVSRDIRLLKYTIRQHPEQTATAPTPGQSDAERLAQLEENITYYQLIASEKIKKYERMRRTLIKSAIQLYKNRTLLSDEETDQLLREVVEELETNKRHMLTDPYLTQNEVPLTPSREPFESKSEEAAVAVGFEKGRLAADSVVVYKGTKIQLKTGAAGLIFQILVTEGFISSEQIEEIHVQKGNMPLAAYQIIASLRDRPYGELLVPVVHNNVPGWKLQDKPRLTAPATRHTRQYLKNRPDSTITPETLPPEQQKITELSTKVRDTEMLSILQYAHTKELFASFHPSPEALREYQNLRTTTIQSGKYNTLIEGAIKVATIALTDTPDKRIDLMSEQPLEIYESLALLTRNQENLLELLVKLQNEASAKTEWVNKKLSDQIQGLKEKIAIGKSAIASPRRTALQIESFDPDARDTIKIIARQIGRKMNFGERVLQTDFLKTYARLQLDSDLFARALQAKIILRDRQPNKTLSRVEVIRLLYMHNKNIELWGNQEAINEIRKLIEEALK